MEQRKKHKKIYLIAGVVLAAALIAGYFFVPYAKRMSYISVTRSGGERLRILSIRWWKE